VNRSGAIATLKDPAQEWDIIVIGGGATGLGAAVDSASRGYHTLLLEQEDFCKATSSRSTKLVHGGVRYLQQGNIALVREALHERGLMYSNAPHLVHPLSFVIPIYSWWGGPFYGVGMKVYDVLAGKLNLAPSLVLSLDQTIKRIPTIAKKGLQRGVEYYDGQFDDARFAIGLALTLEDLGGTAINYMPVTGLLKDRGRTCGVIAQDKESGDSFEIRSRVVINATGVFADGVRSMDDAGGTSVVAPSQGAHIMLPKRFLPGDSAVMIPHTSDGRVLFAIPWHGHVLVGTTDTPVHSATLEPKPLDQELEFLFAHARQYLDLKPEPSDVLSVFAGLRPLVKVSGTNDTKTLSREHTILVSPSHLVTIIGGKWTTYRKMAEDVVSKAASIAGLSDAPSKTQTLPIHGATRTAELGCYSVYGSDAPLIKALAEENPAWSAPLVPGLPYIQAELIWAVRHEMARTVEDVLSRRTRALLLNAPACIKAAPMVGKLLAQELGHNEAWGKASADAFIKVAQSYCFDR
jgi:glycerol-3-phosphate dehydrogenase